MEAAGAKAVRLPARSPNLNAFAERFVLSSKSECLDHLIFFSEAQLRRAVLQLVEHYHLERNHQGLDNELIEDQRSTTNSNSGVECRERVGGILKDYYRRAA